MSFVASTSDRLKPVPLREIKRALERTLFVFDLLLKLENRVEQRFRPRRAARNVNVHRNHLIAPLHDSVVVEHAARSGASAHGNHPLGLGHLVVELTHDRSHFLREPAGHDHQVCLARRRTKNLRAKARHVEPCCRHGHHFNGAAGQPESEWPDGAFARPVHRLVQLCEDDAFVLEQAAKVFWLRQRRMFSERSTHSSSSSLQLHFRTPLTPETNEAQFEANCALLTLPAPARGRFQSERLVRTAKVGLPRPQRTSTLGKLAAKFWLAGVRIDLTVNQRDCNRLTTRRCPPSHLRATPPKILMSFNRGRFDRTQDGSSPSLCRRRRSSPQRGRVYGVRTFF